MILKLLIISSLIPSLLGLGFNSSNLNNRVSKTLKAENHKSEKIFDGNLPNISVLPQKKINSQKVTIYAKNYLLIDSKSNEILDSKNENVSVPIASTTKIMSAIIVLEKYDLSKIVKVSTIAASQIGSDTNLIAGENITIRNLLYCMLIKSGNDAAYVLAENYPGGVEKFVEAMNQKAESLNMSNTHYMDPAGLNPQGYSTAYDLSIITKYALKNDQFASIVKTPEITIQNVEGTRNHDLKNSNRLVNDFAYPGAIGVKTGYLPEAGHCLVGAANRNGHILIAVILNTSYDTVTASAIEARKLLDYGFNNWTFE